MGTFADHGIMLSRSAQEALEIIGGSPPRPRLRSQQGPAAPPAPVPVLGMRHSFNKGRYLGVM